MLKAIFLVFLFPFSLSSMGQDLSVFRQFTPAQLKADLKMLADSLNILHPALHRYYSKKKTDSAFAAATRSIKGPMTVTGFYTLITPLVAMAGDVHTSLELPASVHQSAAANKVLFPFDVRITAGELIVAGNNSGDSSVRLSSRILAINGVDADRVIARLAGSFSSDGFNTTYGIRMAEQRFAFQYPYVFGFDSSWSVRYENAAGEIRQTNVSAVDFDTIRQRREKTKFAFPDLVPAFPQPPFFNLDYPAPGTAVLTLKSFEDQDTGSPGNFRKFVDSAFTDLRLRKVNELIIDIRMNNGGPSANAAYLYSWLTQKPFRFVHSLELTAAGLRRLGQHPLRFVKSKTSGNFITTDTSVTTVPAFFGLGLQPPHPGAYSGNLYVLVDGLTSSGAPQFGALVKRNNRGILAGEETSGALQGGSGRAYAAFALPNTGIVAMVSMVRIRVTDSSVPVDDSNLKPQIDLPRELWHPLSFGDLMYILRHTK